MKYAVIIVAMLIAGTYVFTSQSQEDVDALQELAGSGKITGDVMSQMEAIRTALSKYYEQNGSYPSRVSQLVPRFLAKNLRDRFGTPYVLDLERKRIIYPGMDGKYTPAPGHAANEDNVELAF